MTFINQQLNTTQLMKFKFFSYFNSLHETVVLFAHY